MTQVLLCVKMMIETWTLTFSHGLKVQFPAVATEPGHGSSPDLENVYASWFEATDDHGVGRAPDGGGVVLWLLLKTRKETILLNRYTV